MEGIVHIGHRVACVSLQRCTMPPKIKCIPTPVSKEINAHNTHSNTLIPHRVISIKIKKGKKRMKSDLSDLSL